MRRYAVVVGLVLAACGRSDPTPKDAASVRSSGGDDAPVVARDPAPIVVDDAAWSDDPAGVAWDACGWVPSGAKVSLWAFDLDVPRVHPAVWQETSLWRGAVEARRAWLRSLGLPEAWLRRLIVVDEPIAFTVCPCATPADEIGRALEAKGLVAVPIDAVARGYRQADDEAPFAAVVDGAVVFGFREAAALQGIIDVRRGRAPSARDVEGVREACAAGPRSELLEVEAGGTQGRRAPGEPRRPLASVGAPSPASRDQEVRSVVCASPKDREEMADAFRRIWTLRLVPRGEDHSLENLPEMHRSASPRSRNPCLRWTPSGAPSPAPPASGPRAAGPFRRSTHRAAGRRSAGHPSCNRASCPWR
jgi:hypothetical protein